MISTVEYRDETKNNEIFHKSILHYFFLLFTYFSFFFLLFPPGFLTSAAPDRIDADKANASLVSSSKFLPLSYVIIITVVVLILMHYSELNQLKQCYEYQ
jgi:Na+/H+ antiporter NhaC